MSETAASTPKADDSQDRPPVSPSHLEGAHDALLQHYVRILKEVPHLHPIGGRGKLHDLFGRDLTVWRALVRLFCESHIRHQISTLSKMYALQEGLALSSSKEDSKWFEDAQKSCAKVLGGMSSWHRLKLLTATLSPIIVGLVIARLGAEDVYDAVVSVVSSEAFKRSSAGLLRGLGVAYFVIAIAYLLLPLAGSFSYKRGLFYPAGRFQEQPKWRQRRLERHRKKRGLPSFEQGMNVYQLENELFDLLETRKRSEPRLDLVINICGLVLIVIAYSLSTIGKVDFSLSVIGSTVVLAVLFLIACIRTVYLARRRRWR